MHRGHRTFGLSVCEYVCMSIRSKIRIRVLSKVESQDLLKIEH